MRVAYVSADPGVPVFGRKGCSIHVQEVVRALLDHGAAVTLFTTSHDGEPPPGLQGVPLVRLPGIPKGAAAERERAALRGNEALLQALQREGTFDLVYERYSLWSFTAMEYARAVGVPGVLEVNAPLIEEQAEHRSLVDREAAARVAERVFGAATALVAVSRDMAAYLERFPAARGRVHVVPNGVSPARFPVNARASHPAPPGVFTVGFLGTLKPWHGLPTLTEAFARLHHDDPCTRLLVVGDGSERSRLEAELSARGVRGAAVLTGAVGPEEVAPLLASMDVGVAPYESDSIYFSPLKVFEYMAAGLPVVASRSGQIAELIEDDVTGILCPPGDPAALAAAIQRLIRQPELRDRLGTAARQTMLREHTWDGVVRKILSLVGLSPGECTLRAAVGA